MFPFKAVLVGCSDAVGNQLQFALRQYPVITEGCYRTVDDLTERLRGGTQETRLLLVFLAHLEDVDHLHRVKRALPSWPVLAVVQTGPKPPAALVMLANRAGANQVVLYPIEPQDFHKALDTIAADFASAANYGRFVAVTGVTGGCGTTTLAVNLADLLVHQYHQRTILTELSLAKGALAAYLGVDPPAAFHDLVQTNVNLDLRRTEKALTKVEDRFYLLPGSYHAITPLNITPREVLAVLNHLRMQCAVLVVDVPCTCDDMFLQTLGAAEQVVVVAQHDLQSLRCLRMLLDLFGRSNLADDTNPNAPLHVVLNRANPRHAHCDLNRVKTLLQTPRLLTIANDYRSVGSAINAGKPLRVAAPKSQALADITAVARALFGDPPPEEKGADGIFGRIRRALSGAR
jgi:pilus assembly protein CpaE